jgi:D-glycero-alpha-D-manno-heptose-7-phosphate kinase
MKRTGVLSGVEITTLADIPSEGSGLGSSSSVLVGLLHALYLYKGVAVDAERLAREASEIEIDILKKPIGKQDQYIAAYGGLQHIIFNKDDSVSVKQLSIGTNGSGSLFSEHIMLFFTGITRSSSNILEEQKNNIASKEKILIHLAGKTEEIARVIERNDWKFLGQSLDESWTLKKKLASGITNPAINKMYSDAKKAGAWGGKIAGAGGGGFLLLIVPGEKKEAIRRSMCKFKELRINLEQDGSKAIFNYRRSNPS